MAATAFLHLLTEVPQLVQAVAAAVVAPVDLTALAVLVGEAQEKLLVLAITEQQILAALVVAVAEMRLALGLMAALVVPV